MCCISMATIRQVQNDTMLNLQLREKGSKLGWICLFITGHAQDQLLQQLICHLYSPRPASAACFLSPTSPQPSSLQPSTISFIPLPSQKWQWQAACPLPELPCVLFVCRETMVGWQPCPTWPTGCLGRRTGWSSPVRLSTRARASPRPPLQSSLSSVSTWSGPTLEFLSSVKKRKDKIEKKQTIKLCTKYFGFRIVQL